MPGDDRSLRRLVADLADRDDDDVEAVLALLDQNQRRQLRELLDTYRGRAPLGTVGPALPDWIEARVGGAMAEQLTPLARDTFASCVADWTPEAEIDSRGPSLLRRLFDFVPARRPRH